MSAARPPAVPETQAAAQARPPGSVQVPGQLGPSLPFAQAAGPMLHLQYATPQPHLQQHPRPNLQSGLAQNLQFAAGLARPGLTLPTAGNTAKPPAQAARATDPGAAARKHKKRKIEGTPASPQKTTPTATERLPGSEALTQLQALDEEILKCIAVQKLDAKFALRPGEYARKRLRIYIQSQHQNQLQTPESTADPPSWTLRIWGKLTDPTEGLLKVPTREQQPMTKYVRQLKIKLSGTIPDASGPSDILWQKEKHTGSHDDHFIIMRRGDGDVEVLLELDLDSQPPLLNLEPQLASLVGFKQGTRVEVLSALWNYIKLHQLQESNGQVRCDSNLQALFKQPNVEMVKLGEMLDGQLSTPKPHSILYTIRPSSGARGELVCYDLELRVPVSLGSQQTPLAIDKLAYDAEADRLRVHVNSLVEAAKERARRRDFLLGFSSSPLDFINGLIASQERDLRAVQKSGASPLAMRRSQFFNGNWVEDAVLRYLHRRVAAGG